MARYGKLYRIRPESIPEYKKAHDEIWPEMEKLIEEAGFKNYTIFARKDGTLFACWEHDNLEEGFKIMNASEVRPRWEEHMNKLFVKSDQSIVGPEYEDLEEMWHKD
jgi:L-rhamnose mutarotase